MNNLKISIIIPVYNGALLITRCLDSVFNQKGYYNLEIIVIDDGSNDNSVEIIRNYPRTTKLLQQSNQGPAAARNKGIEIASGKYLAFLDADDYWEPDFLSETVNFLEKFKEAVAVSVGQKHITIRNSGAIVPEFLKIDSEKKKKPVLIDNFFSFWAENFHICTGSILLCTDVAKKTGGQRTDLRITEDLEYWAYLATFGPIGFIPKVLFISDGNLITKQSGWLNKNRRRWASAKTIEKWEERIVPGVRDKDYKPYQKARGRIAKNLCYSMIMSKRSSLAKKTILRYGEYFPNDRVAALLKFGAKNKLLWFATVWLIRIREYTRILF